MPNDLYASIRTTVLDALRGIVPDLPDDIATRVEVTPAREPAHGDMATNAALVAAKPARQPPAKLAAALVAALQARPAITEAAAAGPGFVNLRLDPAAFRALLPQTDARQLMVVGCLPDVVEDQFQRIFVSLGIDDVRFFPARRAGE